MKRHVAKQLPSTFAPDSLATFCDELCAFAAGHTQFAAETTTMTLDGAVNIVSLRVNIIPGCEQTWSRVVVSKGEGHAGTVGEGKPAASKGRTSIA